MHIRPVCFDLDGVIINSEPTHMESFKRTLASRNISLTDEDYTTYFAGKTDKQGFTEFLTAKNVSLQTLPALLVDKTNMYLQLATTIASYSETITLIHRLSRLNTPMAVVTGSNRAETAAALSSTNVAGYFTVVICADDVSRSKPHPEGYLLAAKRLQVSPSDCIAIEDSPSGCAAAKAAGMICVAVTHTHDRADLSHADYITKHLSQNLSTDI